MASNMPGCIKRLPRSWPFDSAGIRNDCVRIVKMMINMLMSARPLAFASCGESAYDLYWRKT